MENVEVSNKSPPPLLLSHKKQGPRHCWRRGNQQRMNWDTRGWRAMDNNQVSSLLPLPLSHLDRKTRSHVAISDVATIRLQTTTTHHDAPYQRHHQPPHHEPPRGSNRTTTLNANAHQRSQLRTNADDHPPTKADAHQRKRTPVNKNERGRMETNAHESTACGQR